ncbi:MAG: glutamate--tRNA ligase [Candidatus Berkelbacteria bacterium]|nr:MAG: glutamate--tRNA ligase [Candidatus Berkelbacteria bacterium]QQG51614.1 MAG: glutamate--tRNA ligase [Candidatus Berkelbacteria bacterium]
MVDNNAVRVRIAPSPTGKLHIGTARTALFNYLFAKKYEGKFIVRMEDTDTARSTADFERDILDGFLWLGMPWDEGPEVGGAFGPYRQQERLGLYQVFINQLLQEKKAYKCYCSPEELEVERKKQQEGGSAPKYSGKCRKLTEEQISANDAANQSFVVRFAVPDGKVEFDDLIKGHVEFEGSLFGDFVIVKSDGMPLFVLSNVIDDHLMEITHVLRGEDHLSNTGKQILLAKALNFLNPLFGHFPLILNPDRTKMSKRKNPVSITDDYQLQGYLPEALNNFIALLGWSSGTDREIYTMHELTHEFEIERVGKSPSVFDKEKLLWMNGYYIRHLSIGDLASRAERFIRDHKIKQAILENPERHLQILALVQDRLKTLDEVEGLIEFFYNDPAYDTNLLIAKKSKLENARLALDLAQAAIKGLDELTLEPTEIALRKAARENGLQDGELLWTVRVALCGRDASPGVFELLEVFGKDGSLKRIALAIKKLGAVKADN